MSSQSNNPGLPPTVVVASAKAASGRDVASIRSQKRSLQAQLPSGSTEESGPTPEELLAQWPTPPETDGDAASLIFQDFCRRREQDSHTSLGEYEERFPEHKASLASLVRQDAFLKSLSGAEQSRPHFSLPEVGDNLFGFCLLHELGRGSFARVFLASQDDLASRAVVLKVSNLEGEEAQTMAMLQHTHIVPIYSVHENKPAGLRAVCMPYFGGASLSAVLKEAGVGSTPVHRGEQLVRALRAVQAPIPEVDFGGSPQKPDDSKVLALLEGYSYPQAAAWIVARLAEGLQHSHSRGVLHRDIKPSNVLLGMDGQPMLLDFNLAQVTRGHEVRFVLGGTINYMAPEHLRSLAARDPTVARQVDHRADIYSLGMVLFEMLVGRGPFAGSTSCTPLPLLVEAMAAERSRAAPSLRQALPDAPWNLESIIGKCMAPMPADRYQQAEHLADDLQRFLDDRPLRYAAELSLRERGRKWSRRHPRLAASGTVGAVAVLLLTILSAALVGTHQLLATTRSDLSDTREHLDRVEAQDLKRAFRAGRIRALCLVNTSTDGHDQLQSGRAACEKTLGLYQILQRDDWQQQPAWQYLDETDRQKIAEDARELLLLLAWAHASAAPGDVAALRQALDLLGRGEAVAELPPLRALWEDRAQYLELLGEAGQARAARRKAAEIAPTCARDHYMLACSFAKRGRHTEAVSELNTALRLNPDHYWSLVQRGICCRGQGELLLAARDFSRCAGLEPTFAFGHYNLACILHEAHKREQAVISYSDALRCDSGFALAYLYRGLAWLELEKFPAALDDLDRAKTLGRDDAELHLGRGAALQGMSRPEQADAAFTRALQHVAAMPSARQTPHWLRYGFAVHKRLPDAAENAFVRVLRQQPHHPQALYGRAMVLVEREKESEAIACFDEALAWHPSFVDARRHRAILLARQGKLAQAQEDVNRCLQQEPEAGIILYAAACVLARAAEKTAPAEVRKQLEDQALNFLKKSFQQGYGQAGASTDPDLRSLRRRPEFEALRKDKPTATKPTGGG